MADLRERVARAIYEATHGDGCLTQDEYLDYADAAIAECRVEELVEALEDLITNAEEGLGLLERGIGVVPARLFTALNTARALLASLKSAGS